MQYKELLKNQIGKKCTFNTYNNKCTINFGAAEPFSIEGFIEDVTDDYVIIKSQGLTMVYLLLNTSISY
jgi:ferredoxin-fold anticodon binding domain-containing protein